MASILNNGSSEDQKVLSFMYSHDLKRIMLNFYKVMDEVITKDAIDKFLLETKQNNAYIHHISDWKTK